MTNLNRSAYSKSLCTNVDADFKEIVSLLPVIHGEIVKARSILKQTNFRNINPNIAEMTTVPSEVADVMREAAQAAESNKFSEFCSTIYETCCKLTTTMERLNRVQYDVASQTAERAQPLEQLQGEVDYMDQAVYLLYTINLEFQKVLLAGNASYIHGLSHVGDQLSEMEGLKETLTRLLAVVSCTHFSNSSTV
uniref:Uncharacterized protein n=1 Tax=Anopheles atroparvus TaxID=41427 RepID=A0AAG5DMD2_ANOAO